jgi:hypothetical protein
VRCCAAIVPFVSGNPPDEGKFVLARNGGGVHGCGLLVPGLGALPSDWGVFRDWPDSNIIGELGGFGDPKCDELGKNSARDCRPEWFD